MVKPNDNEEVRHTDANPEVRDSSVLDKTPEQEEKELSEHSEFEQKTGVREDEIDTRPVVDTEAESRDSYAKRTSETRPWATYQDKASEEDDERAQAASDSVAEPRDEDNFVKTGAEQAKESARQTDASDSTGGHPGARVAAQEQKAGGVTDAGKATKK